MLSVTQRMPSVDGNGADCNRPVTHYTVQILQTVDVPATSEEISPWNFGLGTNLDLDNLASVVEMRT